MNRYQLSAAVDKAVAKALNLTDVAQIAKTEARMVKFMLNEWLLLVKNASDTGARKAKAGAGSEEIISAINKIMMRWHKLVRSDYSSELKTVYGLARRAGHLKSTRRITSSLQYSESDSAQIVSKASPLPGTDEDPDYDSLDVEMATLLAEAGVTFVDGLYDANFRDAVSGMVREKLAEPGQVNTVDFRSSLIKTLTTLAVVGGFRGPINTYIEGLVANAFATSRMAGQLRSMMEVGITHYTISVTVDERTCARCLWMEGKVFSVEDGARS